MMLDLPQLKEVLICPNSFKYTRQLLIDQLPSLQSIKIGKKCFRNDEKQQQIIGNCTITNCPNLLDLEIADDSFHNFRSLKLDNVNSLQSIYIGKECFLYSNCIIKSKSLL